MINVRLISTSPTSTSGVAPKDSESGTPSKISDLFSSNTFNHMYRQHASQVAFKSSESASSPNDPVQSEFGITRRSGTEAKKPTNIDAFEQRARFKKVFRSIVEANSSEFGIKSSAEIYVEESLLRKPVFTKTCLNELYLENSSNETMLIAILKILAHSDRAQLYPVGETVAIAALSHSSIEVRECGVRAFEYWESKDAVTVLMNTHLAPDWLEEYKLEVIRNILES
ncbi:MAG: hypothetical protein ACI9EB_001719 [Pseudomonas sp.]